MVGSHLLYFLAREHSEIRAIFRMSSDLNAVKKVFGFYGNESEGLFERSPSPHQHREILLEIGGGHGAFYRPLPEWIGPVAGWALGPG